MIPGQYATLRVNGSGFQDWGYAFACAVAASRATGLRYRVYRDAGGFGWLWRVRVVGAR